jgi:hypothetical protein
MASEARKGWSVTQQKRDLVNFILEYPRIVVYIVYVAGEF